MSAQSKMDRHACHVSQRDPLRALLAVERLHDPRRSPARPKDLPSSHPSPKPTMVLLSSPAAVIQSIPPVTRAFTAATVLSSALYAWLRWSGVESTPYLTLIPGASIFYPWTFVTSALIETSLLEVRVRPTHLFRSPYSFPSVHSNSCVCSGIFEVLGKPMGKRRDNQVHRRLRRVLKCHRFRSQLDRVHGLVEC